MAIASNRRFGWRRRHDRLVLALLVWLQAAGNPLAAGPSPPALIFEPTPRVAGAGPLWWWQDRLAGLTREARRCASEARLAHERWQIAASRTASAGMVARLAAGQHQAIALGLLRMDERRREQSLATTVIEARLGIAAAALGGHAWRAARDRQSVARAGPLLAALADVAEGLRGRARDLDVERTERLLELQDAAAVAQRRQADWMRARAALAERATEWRRATLERQEIDRRQAAVQWRIRTLSAELAAATALAMPPPSPADDDRVDHKRGMDLERRLDHSLLRLAQSAVKWPGAARYRRLAVASRSQDRFWLQSPSGVRMLAPIAGPLQCPGQPESGPPRAGACIVALVSQIVSAPVAGRVVFAAPFRGFGRLLIIDRGAGYHVVMSGLSQLDVDRGASVVAGQAVGEIVARRDLSARIDVGLRYRGMPFETGPWLAAREDKVRS